MRARNIKPGFFKNDLLVELPFEYRILFIGVWTMADREGRLEDRPTKIRMEIFPADSVDVEVGLQALHDAGFIARYQVGGKKCIQVLAWAKHQNPHMRETASALPPMAGEANRYSGVPANQATRQRIFQRDGNACVLCGCTDDLHLDHIVPRSKGGGEDDDNLQTLCGTCNLKKGSKHSLGDASTQPKQEQSGESTGSAVLIPDSLIPDSGFSDSKGTSTAQQAARGVGVARKAKVKTSTGFERFWAAYPVKKGKADAERHWKTQGLDPLTDLIIAHVQRMQAEDDQWRRRFIPHGSTYVCGKHWQDEPVAAPIEGKTPAPAPSPQSFGPKAAMRESETPLERSLAYTKQRYERGEFGTGTEAMAAYQAECQAQTQKHRSMQ